MTAPCTRWSTLCAGKSFCSGRNEEELLQTYTSKLPLNL